MLRQPLTLGLPSQRDLTVSRESIEGALQQRLSVDHDRARQLLDQVGRALSTSISAGEIAALERQLPLDMRGIIAA
jgi:hypothetical protein